ncbi:GntR family transcriptional regulator [Geosporobacter ferrireducens]|uniref:GntR family transcriptional regulator n=1 Tax=Geosporobacter ferrireducens TaxID=1424294 RepID=A0A1D8GED8_9FIRM|nr:GntR family transcriptional regulator [Geosporobacter ferrireducens]AOT69248.1 GntR family transcriptional regulator [Geosporobacter ferrireducens]MTI56930.1 GntR family transcriptional regulator [Geosporobacter ferrireducens]
MEFDNSKPIYLQIIDDIKKQLIRGELKPGDKILSQRDFAQKIKVNPNTVQRAYREMENMNLVETIRGQGTFIYSREGMLDEIKEEMASRVLKNFLDEMYSLGFDNEKIIELVEKCQQRLEEDRL